MFTLYFKKSLFTVLIASLFITSSTPTVNAKNNLIITPPSTGYSALKLFLEDEQYLTVIRRTNMVLTFSDIHNDSSELIDQIANSSEKALEELEKYALINPEITYVDFSDELIGKATFDSLRITTGKDFLFESDEFEKNLLVSQLKILRVISHLAMQLKEKESNEKRKKWLIQLASTYEDYYQKVNASLTINVVQK